MQNLKAFPHNFLHCVQKILIAHAEIHKFWPKGSFVPVILKRKQECVSLLLSYQGIGTSSEGYIMPYS